LPAPLAAAPYRASDLVLWTRSGHDRRHSICGASRAIDAEPKGWTVCPHLSHTLVGLQRQRGGGRGFDVAQCTSAVGGQLNVTNA